ncbi:MAG: acetylornithine carbamoyltransferase, partial [Bacteroidota bacterium]
MNHFSSITSVNRPKELLQFALDCKANPHRWSTLGNRRTLGLLFFNPSLRTRLSTQKAAQNLGMQVLSMDVSSHGWKLEFEPGVVMNSDKAEHIKEAAAVVSQYCDIIGVRCFPGLTNREKDYSEQVLSAFIKHASVPIINLESATSHPLQGLADWMTISEYKKTRKPRVVLSWAPHPKALPQSVANSFVKYMQIANVDLTITHPKGYDLAPEIVQNTRVTTQQEEAMEGADFVYAKNWSSYQDYGKVLTQDPNWTITPDKLGDAFFMHCLPVRRNVVVSDAVLDGEQSLVIQQAQNRTYAAQAAIISLLK